MRILGCVPVYADSPHDALWRELAKTHHVDLWGHGRDGYVRGAPLGEAQARFGGKPYDLVLCADPGRRDSSPWDLSGVDASYTAAFIIDGCYGVQKTVDWARGQHLDLLLVRGRDDVPAVREAAANSAAVEWLPFGYDPDVFHDYHLPKRWDVGVFGHLGSPYPARSRARDLLDAQSEFSVLDAALGGCETPVVTGVEYARLINQCRVVVVGCGKWRYVVQKYYEVPACGVALVATKPEHGFEQLFAPGVHLDLFADDCTDLLEVVGGLLGNEPRRLRLAAAGHAHALSHHMNAHRVKWLERILGWPPTRTLNLPRSTRATRGPTRR